ncbi:erythromycin esterase family protein [Antrihabitans cavernicola]|uniref:Erythromycin esterase family protein n=1 Tax=Antrihabitans cavernicola TaxID=2495913 RepID=A0A5A7SIF1_9NOCA|nr:erythromycin esterase family protein [Spelaeibacter cavernicola]KAA0024507.1 erythromycin esterase family protein [Spelaeibacter cavernicola]
MSQDIRDFVPSSCDLLALGEPTHWEPAFGSVRNTLFGQLVERGFRSIALETDRVAALEVDDYVRDGVGSLYAVMRDGFSHDFGDFAANRALVEWMREYNQNRSPADRLAFHGFDTQTEIPCAPSPRRYLEYSRDYLGLDVDLASIAGDDERWSRAEAVLNPAESLGATPEAQRLRLLAHDMFAELHERAPELIAKTSRNEWTRATTHLTAGIGLLRYHNQAAQDIEQSKRYGVLGAVRDAIMAQNLRDIRSIEDRRGATFVFAHNFHLNRGSIVGSLLDYTFVAGSLGRSDALELGAPAADTYEGTLDPVLTTWGITEPPTTGRTRTDTDPRKGYFPLDQAVLDGADAILYIAGRHTR